MHSKKLIVKVAAGLGNQMFMYANAYALSKEYDLNLTIDDTSGFFQNKNKTFSREYGLDMFNLSAKKSCSRNKFDNYAKHILKKLLIFFDFFFLKKKFIKEKTNRNKITSFTPIMLDDAGQKIYIEGYYQSEKYFSKEKKNIQKEFLITLDNPNINEKYKQMLIDKNSISLHVRRNRFKSDDGKFGDPNYDGLITFNNVIDYLNRGINYFKNNTDNPHFFIWSDNFENIEEYFEGDNFTFIKGLNIKQDFYLFQFAKNFIVSPSTFHWWGAWLNTYTNKICLRPKDINPSHNKDFWPDEWISI